MRKFLFILLTLLTPQVLAQGVDLIELTDPAGDDWGDGSLIYPTRNDYAKGDLDLRKLKIRRDDGGFWFDAEFANPIRDPSLATTGVGPESIAASARRGFYSFNIDIYVDMDRKPGSGNQFTLPGRKVRIAPAYAWERAVILTPRPETMRSELLDALSRQFPDRTTAEAEASIDLSIFFAKRVRIRGRTVSFFVPKEFFAGSDGTDWAITALITGAKAFDRLSLGLLPSSRTPLEELDLGVMQPQQGRPADTFGYDGGVSPSPVVDALLPSAQHQTALLSGKSPLTGMSWGRHAANEMASAPKVIPVQPTVTSAATVKDESFFSNPFGSLRRLLGNEPASQVLRNGPVAPVQNFLDQSATGVPASAVAGQPAAASATPLPFAERLRTLQKLYEQKLIDEAEFKSQRQRILNQL